MKKRAPSKERAEVRASAKKRVPCPEVPFTVVSFVAPIPQRFPREAPHRFPGRGVRRANAGVEWRCRHDGCPASKDA